MVNQLATNKIGPYKRSTDSVEEHQAFELKSGDGRADQINQNKSKPKSKIVWS